MVALITGYKGFIGKNLFNCFTSKIGIGENYDKEYIELEHPLMSINNLDRELYKFNNRLDNYRNLHTADELGWINIEHYKGKYYISKDDNIENNKKKYYENFKIEDINKDIKESLENYDDLEDTITSIGSKLGKQSGLYSATQKKLEGTKVVVESISSLLQKESVFNTVIEEAKQNQNKKSNDH